MRSTLEGSWKNQHGSVLRIDEVSEDGSLRGSFCPGVGLARGGTFPILGTASADVLAFTVGFGPHGITSWVGYRDEAHPDVLSTTWMLVIGASDVQDPMWKRTLTGADVFRLQAHAEVTPRAEQGAAVLPDVP